jgi:hypothetical protein
MSTVRTTRRWIPTDRFSLGLDGRELVIVTCLCVAVFACFFVIGRVASPGSGPREEASLSLQVAVGGTAIPVRLSSAPPIEIGAPAGTKRLARGKAPGPLENVAASAPEFTSEAPPVQATRTEALPATPQPPVPAVPTSPREHSKSAPGAGKSFDSSG